MDIFFDTTVLVAASEQGHPHYAQARPALQRVAAGRDKGFMSAHSIAEVYAGVREEETAPTASFLDSLECHGLTASSGRLAGMLKNIWARKGRTLSLSDTIIAAIAIENDCTLVTDNRKDFPMPELKLYPLQ